MIPITTSDGHIFDPDDHKPEVIGYQIKHNLTGRILPSTTRKEVYSKAAAIHKMDETAITFNMMSAELDIWEYDLVPIYDFEREEDFIYISDKDDNLFCD